VEKRWSNYANVRMGKKQRMRWSPRGAHRVAVVRAAVLDGRLKSCGVIPMAAWLDQRFSTPFSALSVA
jgi:hypothetical protein